MTLPFATPRSLAVILVAAAVSAIAGCGGDPAPITSASSKYEVADGDSPSTETLEFPDNSRSAAPNATFEPAAAARPDAARPAPGTAPQRPPATPPPGASGPASDKPDDLMAYVAELATREPTGVSQEEVIADYLRTQDELVAICSRVFAMETTPALKFAAAESKVQSLIRMSQVGNAAAPKQLDEFVVALNASPDEALQNLGFKVGFSNRMQALQSGQDVDPLTVIDDLNHLIATEAKDEELLGIGHSIAAILEQTGHLEQAVQAFRLLAETFKGSDDERLRAEASNLTEQAQLLDSDITTMLSAVLEAKEGAGPPFVTAAEGLLQSEGAGFVTLGFFQQFAPTLELAAPEVAGKIYAAIGAAFKENPNQDLAKLAAQIAASYEIRASLTGKPFAVEGTTLDGQVLDWSQYQGKPVLVVFWTTQIEASLLEMPNIRENYERFHEHGFEVVGINLDTDIQSLRRFLAIQQLPWPTVLGSDPETRQSALAKKYGVVSIPFMVLVGEDGNVLAANLRGDQLSENLAKLFPAAAAPLPPAKAEDDKAQPAASADATSGRSNGAAEKPPAEPVPSATPSPDAGDGAQG